MPKIRALRKWTDIMVTKNDRNGLWEFPEEADKWNQGEHDMSEDRITWEEASASVGVSAHGSYNLERALKDAGYVKFEYDFEHLENGGYRILDKRVKESKGPWFVDWLMSAEDWQVLQPIALQAVADMREVRRVLDERNRKLARHLWIPSRLCQQPRQGTARSVNP